MKKERRDECMKEEWNGTREETRKEYETKGALVITGEMERKTFVRPWAV